VVEETGIAIHLLQPMTPPKAIEELSAILKTEDIEHPIVVYKTTKEEWAEHKKAYPYIYDSPDIEGEIMQIRAGHNRVEWARRQGDTYIRALVYNNLEDATEECKRQMKWHKRKHGALI